MTYPWMPAGENIIRKNYLPDDFEPVLKSVGISRTIVVQANHTLEETDFLLDLADRTNFVAGVIVWVDLQSDNVYDVLNELLKRPKLVGVRHQVEDDPDRLWLVRKETLNGLAVLADLNLVYDVLVKPHHLDQIPIVADKIPNLKMVINHIAKPLIADAITEPWATDIARVAEIPTIQCKISGMVTEAHHSKWQIADLKPYVSHIIDSFGMQRLMFGSDWPVCLLAADYAQVLDTTLQSMGCLSTADASSFLGENAARFYNLST